MINITADLLIRLGVAVLALTAVMYTQAAEENTKYVLMPTTDTLQSADLDEPFSNLLIGILSNDVSLTTNAIINDPNLLNRSSNAGELPIHIAVSLGYADIVNVLLTQSTVFDVNQRTKTGPPPLLIAVQNGSVEIARMLLDAGADPNLPSGEEDGTTIKDIALQHPNPSLVRLFDATKADNLEKHYAEQIRKGELFDAVLENDIDYVKTYFVNGAGASIVDQNGWTPFAHAVSQGHTEIATLFIDQGENINQMYGVEKLSALMIASASNDVSMVTLLLEAGANPDLKQYQNLSAIDYANAMGYTDILAVINKNTKEKDIFTAAKEGDLLFISENLHYLNQLHDVDKEGWTPLMHAVANKRHNFVAMLLEKSSDRFNVPLIKKMTSNGESPLSLAVINGDTLMVDLLISYNAPLERQVGNNINLDQLARHRGYNTLAKKIKQQRLILQRELQTHLLFYDQDIGKVDGVIGKNTLKAINNIKEKMGRNPSYLDIIEYIDSQQERDGYIKVYICNQSDRKAYYARGLEDSQGILMVSGWQSAQKNTCNNIWIKNNKGIYIHNNRGMLKRSPRQKIKKACAPSEVFRYNINVKCSSENTGDYYWFEHKPDQKFKHKHIVAWLR